VHLHADARRLSAVTPKEAGAIELEEPDWRIRFEEHVLRWPKLPDYLARDSAFEATMSDWRRFHWTPIEVDGKLKKRPAGATEAIIALAKLGIFPPRSLIRDIPRGGELHELDIGDDHCWLQISGRAWRITAIEDRMLVLDSFGEDKQIDLNRARWTNYVESALAVLQGLG
jgi:hypothetical protein